MPSKRFFGDIPGSPEPDPASVLPAGQTPEAFAARLEELARPRLAYLAWQNDAWWLETRSFFDVERHRILRLPGKPVVSIYGPAGGKWGEY
jgi:hypothetical protein